MAETILPPIFLGIISAIILLIGTPFISALILSLFTRWFKFKKTDFKTALYSVLIVFVIMVAITSILPLLFLDKINNGKIFAIIAFLASFIVGFYVIFKSYKESLGKCFIVWILTCLAVIISFVILVIIVALIFVIKR